MKVFGRIGYQTWDFWLMSQTRYRLRYPARSKLIHCNRDHHVRTDKVIILIDSMREGAILFGFDKRMSRDVQNTSFLRAYQSAPRLYTLINNGYLSYMYVHVRSLFTENC